MEDEKKVIHVKIDLPKEINSKFLDVSSFDDPSECKNDDELLKVVGRHTVSTTVGVILGAMVDVFMDDDSCELDEARKDLICRLEDARKIYHKGIEKCKGNTASLVFKGISGGLESFSHDLRNRLGGRNG